MPLIQILGLKKHFVLTKGVLRKKITGVVKAVDGVNLDVESGETLGLVGETGCGKSTLGRLIMGLESPTTGTILFNGRETSAFGGQDWRRFRSEVQIIFQDPYSSLNPRMKVRNIIGEPLKIHGLASDDAARRRVRELLSVVGLDPLHAERFPHEFSGGQRQRIGIARALALNPKLLICDEPVSALDVSIQAQVLNLLRELQRKFYLTYLFISHDLSVVKHIATRVAVMYLGRIIELGPAEQIFSDPQHPYTEALLSACPIPDPDLKARPKVLLTGDPPSPLNPPEGCSFHPRCRYIQPACRTQTPAWEWKDKGSGHGMLCPVAPFLQKVSGSAIHFKEAVT